MNLCSTSEVKKILAEFNLRPNKKLGQNFLIDRNILHKIIESAEILKDDCVLEIGSGLGVLTQELSNLADKLIAVETDTYLIPVLDYTLLEYSNINLVHQDILKIDFNDILSSNKKYIVVGNLPYYITTPIISHLIENKHFFSRFIVMVQREVANRMTAKPNSEDYGSLSLYLNYHCKVSNVMNVSKNCFYPVPDVDSSVVRIDILDEPSVKVKDEKLLFAVIKAAFGQRRKTLHKSLEKTDIIGIDKTIISNALESANIDADRRGETLSIEEFALLSDAFTNLL
ncbi:MAG: 16S rRNA (adenine(1518)-N(6)/adenine(1519)-N(6))-dimethyltransferase RsmA [Armatimonadota bacterium]